MASFPQGNENYRPRGRNPMNLTIDTSGDTLAGANNNKNKSSNDLQPQQQLPQQNRFPLNSPITAEIPSPEHSSGSETGSKLKPKLVNAGLGGSGGIAGERLDLHADSALSKTQLERTLRERLELGSKTTRNMSSSSSQQQQQRPAGLQLMTEFGRDDVQSEKGTFLDLSDLKSIANAREKERLREYNSSSQSLQQPVQERAEELSPSDRPIMIGLTVPYDESTPRSAAAAAAAAGAGETIDSASSRTPATPSIVVTPAREHPPWHTDMNMDMSTSPEMLHRPRAASSIYSQPSPKPMHDEDAPPVPAIPAFHSVTSFQRAIYDQRPVSTDTEFEGEEQVSSTEKESSPTTTRKNMKKKLLHKLSVNTSDANRPDSQGWWTYLLSPLLSRSNTVSSRRTALSPQQNHTRSARSPLSAVSFSKALSHPQPTDEGESSHWWDDEKIAIPPEKSHFSPDTPEDMTRHVQPIGWDMPFLNEHITTINPTAIKALPEGEKAEKTRSVFQIGDQMVPNYELHGSRAEYYQASAHDLNDKENPYFECINHVCSMTSAKRRAEIEAAEKEAEERLMVEAENQKGGLAVFVFDPSRDANNPFIAFLEARGDVKEVTVDGDEKPKEEGEQDGEKREIEGEEVEKTGLSNARELLSFDSSDEDDAAPADPEKEHTTSRGLSHSPDLGPTSRNVASFSPPPRSRYEPSVSLLPPAEERGFSPPPPAPPSVSYSRGTSPPPAPAPVSASAPTYVPPAPAPAPAPAPVPVPVQMPMMPPPQPRAFSPEPVPMPMAPPPQPRAISPEPVPMPMAPPPQPHAFSPEPVAMPITPPAPVPVPAPPPPREPVPMPMPVSRSPPADERAQVAMPPPPQPPSDDARGIPGGYHWEPAPLPRAMSPPRPTRVASPPMPSAAPGSMSQAREVEDSVVRPGLGSERDAEPAPITRPAPSFSRPGPFLAPRRVPQPPAPATSQQSASDAPADESDAESVLPPYSRNAPRQPGLPTYSARDQSDQRDRAPVAPEPVSPGLQQAMTSRGGIPMSDVSQRTRDMDFNDAGSISRPSEPRTIINVHHYYNGEHPRDAPEPPRPGNQFVSEADLQSRDENEARRQRLEKEDKIAKKIGGFWRGRGCIPKRGCFGRDGREGRNRRRWYVAIVAFCILVIVLSISLATTLTHKGDRMSVESEWLNITGFPPIPTGIMTVAGPAPAVERSSCVAPTSLWSCALPPEQQASNAGGYAPDAPNFRIEIRFRNDSSLSSNSTASNSTTKRSWGGIFRRDDWTASPAAPRLIDQTFLGNTTDNITTPFQGEETPFYITFLSPVDVANASAQYVKRDVVSSTATATGTGTGTGSTTTVTHPGATGTASTLSATGTGTGTAAGTGTKTSIKTATGTQTQTGTSTSTGTSTPEIEVGKLIPAPDLASDGTAAAATLYPLPVQQPIKLYNRGLPTEHYGFFTYFDKSIFLASDASITGGSTDTDSRDTNGGSTSTEASVRCTWSQTRFLVQIWTQPQNVTRMSLSAISNTTATTSSSTASAASSTATSKSSSGSVATSSANNFTSPGSFPYPITITIDRHGGIATEKLAYCYAFEQHNSSSSSVAAGPYYNLTSPKLQDEQRDSGGSIVQPSPDYFVLAAALAQGATADEESPVDGGTGGCMCEWRNWVETH